MKLHIQFSLLENYIPVEAKGHQWLQIAAVWLASLGSINTGALMAWTSPAIPILTSNSSYIEPITLEEASYFTVIPPFSAILCSPLMSLSVNYIGRKKTIFLLSVFYFLSWILIASANNLTLLYVSRILAGCGDAALFTVIPMYVGEVTEPHVRSRWGILIAFLGFVGQFFINAIGSYCSIRSTALILSSIPLIQFFLMLLMPESPYFLLMKGKHQEAKTALKILRWKQNIDEEFSIFSKSVQEKITDTGSFKDLFFNPTNRKSLIIGIGIRAAQQFSGIPAFFMYTQYLFQQGGSNLSATTSAIIFTGLFVIVIAVLSYLTSDCGRKPLMIFSCLGCGVVLAVEAIYFYIHEKTSLDISNVSWLPLAAMILYIPMCGVGLGIIPSIMLGELFATSVKGNAMCILNISFSVLILMIGKLFPTLSENFGMYVPFCIFAVLCFINVSFSYYCLPETKDKTLEEIQESIAKRTNKR